MPGLKDYSEDALVERPAIELFKEIGWETLNCFHEFDQPEGSPLGRETKAEVVLRPRLKAALEKLNPTLPAEAITQAVDELARGRGTVTLVEANRQVYDLLKHGVKVRIPDKKVGETVERVRVIDWDDPKANDFLLCSQFWVTGEMYTRRADLVGFVNGLPLLFVELKASHKRLENAYKQNLSDYKTTIPHLLWHNALILLSNGSESRVGSVSAAWGHFTEWKKINSEGEQGVVSLETAIRGTCEPGRFLDLVENFTLFQEVRGGLVKLVAKNHQYLGVNNVLQAIRGIKKNQGRLGVFWHTQGSGKTVAMIFFSQKVLRKIPGNWTFVIVTDRSELDHQAYKEFARSGVVTEKHPQATSSSHLRKLLTEDHRYVFTLIHKFRTERGEKHPVLSKRSDVVVIADEAHRTQYDTLAMNMRTALPSAAFIAFTGTPLMVGEEKTRNAFGDYVSIYNFKQSVDDEATVPLFYENRIPELQLTNENLNEELYQVIEETELDEEQEKKLERELGRQYHLITRDDRLERIAQDMVEHFMGRGHRGKAMVVCIDKATAVRMYDKVRKHWMKYQAEVKRKLRTAPADDRDLLLDRIRYMDETDMAVVVSQGQGEVEEMKKKGLDIRPHRKRMVTEEMDEKFKDPDDPFRIVFVCAMWMTGFDAPACSTIYVDKPMRNHTLMQTIARANRVFRDKVNGLIVDYVGVFREMEKALAIYGSDYGGGVKPGECPVQQKSALVAQLRQAIEDAKAYCLRHGLDVNEMLVRFEKAKAFEKVKLLDDARDMLVTNDQTKRRYLLHAAHVARLFKAILPDPAGNELAPVCTLLAVIAEKIRALTPPADVSAVMERVEGVLDRSIAAEGYVIRQPTEEAEQLIDLSRIDFKALKRKFQKGRKHTEAERLKSAITRKLHRMVRLNRTRVDYLEKFQHMIEEYNSGAINIEEFFKRLMALAKELTEEEQRTIKESLTEEELTIFDLLTKPEMELTERERKEVKKVARELLGTLKTEKLVLDWRKRQQSRAAVRLTIHDILDRLPERYTESIYEQKCQKVYQHVFESYFGDQQSVFVA